MLPPSSPDWVIRLTSIDCRRRARGWVERQFWRETLRRRFVAPGGRYLVLAPLD